MKVSAATYNWTCQGDGTATGAILPLPLTVLPLSVDQPVKTAVVKEGSAVVPHGAILPLAISALLSIEGQRQSRRQKVSNRATTEQQPAASGATAPVRKAATVCERS